jgi:hypothetical protein
MLFLLALVVIVWVVCLTIGADSLPERWSSTQSLPNGYEISLDRRVFHTGKASAHIRSRTDDPQGLAKLIQTVSAVDYLGNRLRMSAYLRTETVVGSAYLWLRVDGPGNQTLAYGDTHETPLQGTTNWTRHEVNLEVPRQAQQVTFGVVMTGTGHAWVDDFSFQVVDNEGQVVGPDEGRESLNLGFD